MMVVPEAVAEALQRLDPLLVPMWDKGNSRWRILRRNPRNQREFFTILNVQEDDGSFRPLDRRTVLKLYEMDVQRQYAGRQQKYFGQFIERDLQLGQEELDKQKAKANNELMRQARDEFHFGVKKLERRGKL